MAITLKITRTLLSLADLDLIAANGYEVISDGLDMGNVVQRRDWAKSAFVAGAALLSAVDDITNSSVKVEVFGSSRADLQTKVGTLLTAFKQIFYILKFDLDGTTWSWNCFSADRIVDLDFPMYLGNLTTVTLAFQRQPTPVSGPY